MTIQELMERANKTAVEKGWWESGDRNFGEQIALMHSELSEALEEWRKWHIKSDWFMYTEASHIKADGSTKPEGIAVEFADVLIRIADTCKRYGIPLEEALEAKMAYNETRPYRHGGKLA